MFEALRVLDSVGVIGGVSQRRYHDDITTSVFVENELKQIVPEMYNRLFPELTARKHVPGSGPAVSPGATAWSYDSMDQRGQAQWMGANATDIPRADAQKRRKTFPIRTAVIGYGWNLEEIEAARFAGTALDRAKADAARRAMAEFEHNVILFGDASRDIPGFLTNPATPRMALPNGAWLTTADADEMVEDLNALADQVYFQSNRVHRANTLLLPLQHFRLAMTTRIPEINETVASFFLRTNGYVRELMELQELSTAGPGGTPVALAYQKDPGILGPVIPLGYSQMEPQMQGFETVIPAREKLGGTIWFYPFAGCFGDGL